MSVNSYRAMLLLAALQVAACSTSPKASAPVTAHTVDAVAPAANVAAVPAPVPVAPAVSDGMRALAPRAPLNRPRQAAAPTPAADPAQGVADQPPAQFTTDARWEIAGYNNDEVIYTILISNHDSRILRCSTQLKGWYYEDGKKMNVSDRQTSTVLPGQQAQAGNWMGMDEQSPTTYSVKCRPL